MHITSTFSIQEIELFNLGNANFLYHYATNLSHSLTIPSALLQYDGWLIRVKFHDQKGQFCSKDDFVATLINKFDEQCLRIAFLSLY